MADNFLTIADVLRINDSNIVDAGFSDILNNSPALAAMPTHKASHGTLHKYEKEITAPVVGFRTPGNGKLNSAGTSELVTIALKMVDASNGVDKAVADEYPEGPEALIKQRAVRHLRSGLYTAEQQLWYGTGADADGFVGLFENGDFDGAKDDRVYNVGGTTVGGGSSVVMARIANDGMSVVTGKEGTIEVGQSYPVHMSQNNASGDVVGFGAWYTDIKGWFGLQIGSKWDACRIANLTEESGNGLTDSVIQSAYGEKFPVDHKPNAIFLSRRSMTQLVNSRTATNPTGAPAPFPADVYGMQVVITDSLKSDEAIVA